MFTRIANARLASLATAVALLAGAQAVHANDQDLIATTVPATSCQPASHSQAAEVVLSNAAWVFSGSNTGTVIFYCPLPVNRFTKSDATDDNDILGFRVYYRDTDGMGTDAEVTARLYYRATGLVPVGAEFTSNDNNETDDTKDYQAVAHDVNEAAMYSFVVTLSRTSTAESPAFTGIDFALEPQP
jgi:hypothetical protein